MSYSIYINSDTRLVYSSLSRAIKVYSESQGAVCLMFQSENNTYIVLSRLLSWGFAEVESENAALKLIGGLT